MEQSYSPAREKSRPPPLLRLSTRSSSSLSNLREPLLYPAALVRHPLASPTLSQSHSSQKSPKHSWDQFGCLPGTTTEPVKDLSRKGSMDSARQPARSSFLQEKLEQERRAECDKLTRSTNSSRTNTDVGQESTHSDRQPSAGLREAEDHQKQSAENDGRKKNSMGLREMEKNISDLHKQNFNLKLEVSKRREKQIELEARLTEVSREKDEADEMNDNLLNELEKRDKAIEEAVRMIVMLEAKVETLSQGASLAVPHDGGPSTDFEEAPLRNPYLEIVHIDDGYNTVSRVPSFISEQTEQTETLRAVYLHARNSITGFSPLSTRNSGVSSRAEQDMASPTFSNLSQSSFPSIYGWDEDTPRFRRTKDSAHITGLNHANRASRPESPDLHARKPHSREPTPTQPWRQPATNPARQFQSTSDFVGQQSPLQKIEYMEPNSPRRGSAHPRGHDKDAPTRTGSTRSSPGWRTRREQHREALRMGICENRAGVHFHEATLPPTPDTWSTSTLRRLKTSDETLSQPYEARSDQSRVGESQASPNVANTAEGSCGARLDAKRGQRRDEGRVREFMGGSYFEPQAHVSHRSRSAGSFVSPRPSGQDWNSESEDSDGGDGRSIGTSDIWMREGTRPPRDMGRISPDLFGFPVRGPQGDWALGAMFAKSGRSEGVNLQRAPSQMHNGILPTDLSGTMPGPPPAPHRSSSRKAPKGSRPSSAQDHVMGQPGSPRARMARAAKRNSESCEARAAAQIPTQDRCPSPSQPGSSRKRSHYPPIAGQQNPRSGLNRILHRSFGSIAKSKSDGAGSSKYETPGLQNPQSSIPSAPFPWMADPALGDDRSGATPPPIQRISRHARIASTGAVSERASTPEEIRGDPTLPKFEPASCTVAEQGEKTGTGSRRKWLPFGRSGSVSMRRNN